MRGGFCLESVSKERCGWHAMPGFVARWEELLQLRKQEVLFVSPGTSYYRVNKQSCVGVDNLSYMNLAYVQGLGPHNLAHIPSSPRGV